MEAVAAHIEAATAHMEVVTTHIKSKIKPCFESTATAYEKMAKPFLK
jgi:hypothetical protein